MNDTLRLLERAVFMHEKVLLLEDLDYQGQKEEYEALYSEFRERHTGNHALIREVGNLLDAKAVMAEHHVQFRLLLGLQMGMELRETRLLSVSDMQLYP